MPDLDEGFERRFRVGDEKLWEFLTHGLIGEEFLGITHGYVGVNLEFGSWRVDSSSFWKGRQRADWSLTPWGGTVSILGADGVEREIRQDEEVPEGVFSPRSREEEAKAEAVFAPLIGTPVSRLTLVRPGMGVELELGSHWVNIAGKETEDGDIWTLVIPNRSIIAARGDGTWSLEISRRGI